MKFISLLVSKSIIYKLNVTIAYASEMVKHINRDF